MESANKIINKEASLNHYAELRNKFISLSEEEKVKLAQAENKALKSSGKIPPGKVVALITANTQQTPKILYQYWKPALNGSENKTLDYLVYKTYGYDKEDGDPIAYDQLLNGVCKDGENGEKIRIDWGTGNSKEQLADSIAVLEILGLIEVKRGFRKGSNEKATNLYRVRVLDDISGLKREEVLSYLSEDPFIKVRAARELYKQYKLDRKVVG